MKKYASGRFKFDLDDGSDDEASNSTSDNQPTLSNIKPSRFTQEIIQKQEHVVQKQINCTLRMRSSDDNLIKISFDCEVGDTASKIIGEMADEGLISRNDQDKYENSLNEYLASDGVTQVFRVDNANGRQIDESICIGFSKFTGQE